MIGIATFNPSVFFLNAAIQFVIKCNVILVTCILVN
jgi:hypothetical protein